MLSVRDCLHTSTFVVCFVCKCIYPVPIPSATSVGSFLFMILPSFFKGFLCRSFRKMKTTALRCCGLTRLLAFGTGLSSLRVGQEHCRCMAQEFSQRNTLWRSPTTPPPPPPPTTTINPTPWLPSYQLSRVSVTAVILVESLKHRPAISIVASGLWFCYSSENVHAGAVVHGGARPPNRRKVPMHVPVVVWLCRVCRPISLLFPACEGSF